MFRRTIRLNERADVQDETNRLRDQALRAGLEPAAVEQLATAFGTTLGSLVDAGTKLNGHGSQISVSRFFEGPGYAVNLRFGGGQRAGFFDRMMQAIRGL